MLIKYDSYTDIGHRACNEDSVFIGENGSNERLFVVADGLGGHGGGDKASQLTTELLSRDLGNGALDISASISEINEAVLQLQQEQGLKCRSTVALVHITGGIITAATVGDTRIYAFRNGEIAFQSIDHSGAQLAVSIGDITPDQIRGHEDRSILTRALGASETVKVDVRELDDEPDAMLICSDGFWECITASEMLEELDSASTASEWLARMVSRVKNFDNDDKDNNSAIAIMMHSS
ncbi:MAG: serine/threonine-protein phosphatase [Ruminococcaceae bacterium]|nr:serine/threonine-protein phosphatase [Oscillospiraceae bacterium]